MKLYYYRGGRLNFGDELNTWLLPKIFPGFFDDDPSKLFLGIGSIINNDHDPKALKIVFGSGYGGYKELPLLDETWRFYGVRGPRTAQACGLPESRIAADAAILINLFRNPKARKTQRFAFMPHWESIGRGHWEIACRLAGIKFLSPWRPVPDLIDELELTEVLITEAMHGAIVADALRVPWIGVRPIHASHRMKWFDWSEALGIDLQPQPLSPSSHLEMCFAGDPGYTGRFLDPRGMDKPLVKALDVPYILKAAASLRRCKKAVPSLSSEEALAAAVKRLQDLARQIRQDFPGRSAVSSDDPARLGAEKVAMV